MRVMAVARMGDAEQPWRERLSRIGLQRTVHPQLPAGIPVRQFHHELGGPPPTRGAPQLCLHAEHSGGL
jgi:hypothetical protein